MRFVLTSLTVFALSAVLLTSVGNGQDKEKDKAKEVTLTGTVCCAKCELNLVKKCHTVIVLKEKTKDGKDDIVWFDSKSNGAYHKETCQEAKKGTVTGTVTTADDKKTVAVSKVTYDK